MTYYPVQTMGDVLSRRPLDHVGDYAPGDVVGDALLAAGVARDPQVYAMAHRVPGGSALPLDVPERGAWKPGHDKGWHLDPDHLFDDGPGYQYPFHAPQISERLVPNPPKPQVQHHFAEAPKRRPWMQGTADELELDDPVGVALVAATGTMGCCSSCSSSRMGEIDPSEVPCGDAVMDAHIAGAKVGAVVGAGLGLALAAIIKALSTRKNPRRRRR